MMKRVAFRIVFLVLAGTMAGAVDATVHYEDLDGDGQAEIILANQYLKVELMSGVPPVPPSLRWYQRLFNAFRRKRKAGPAKYGRRFVWAGWIRNIEFVPSGRRWFIDRAPGGPIWQGIPEEFGQTVKMAELEDGSFACLKVGIGEAIGKGLCLRGNLTLTKPAPWVFETATTEDGASTVTFTQRVETSYSCGYVYRKVFRLERDSSVLQVTRSIQNAGVRPIHTSWYSHGFWGQGDSGPDGDCWSTVPLQDLAGDAADVDTTRCRVADLSPACYWGPVSAAEMAEPWYASGYGPTREVFVSGFSERLAWFRMWTNAKTYSCEPFVLIDLQPGETKTWTVTRGSVRGIDAATASGPGAVLDLGGLDEDWLHASISPYRPLSGVQVRLRYRAEGAAQDALDHTATLAKCGPDWPGRLRLERHRLPAGPCVFQITATHQGQVLLDTTRRILPRTAGLPPAWLGAAGGKQAIVLADVQRLGDLVKPTPATAYWVFALERAGFAVSVLPIGDAAGDAALATAQLVVVSGPVRVPNPVVKALTSFVGQGGGLVMTGPLDLRPFELSDLLPVTAVTADVIAQGRAPRDGTREFLDAPRFRYQLQLLASHPTVEGVPLYPSALQGIGRLQVVEPRAGSQTILTYTGPESLQPKVDSPALVVGTHGQGRVAVFASPVNWGTPQIWSLWSRLGEHHQQFLGLLGQWAAGKPAEATSK